VKKTIAIAFLLLQVFSLFGPIALYEYCLHQSDKLFNEQISQSRYKIDDLVEVKLPVQMPTIQDWKEYSYVSGQVQLQNGSYNYVKIKMTRDTIFLMCVPNYRTTKLIQQNVIDARKIADIPVNKKERVPLAKTNALGAYSYQAIQFRFLTPIATLKKSVDHTHSGIVKSFIARPGQPPEC
jgi:hypothetical protein